MTHGTSSAFKNTHPCVNHYNSMNAKEKILFPHLASCQLRHYHVHKYCQCRFEIKTDFWDGIVDTVAEGEKKDDPSHCLIAKSS